MQIYAQPALTTTQGRSIWLAMSEEVRAQRLMAPHLTRTLTKIAMLFLLFSIALRLSWFETSWIEAAAGYVLLSILMVQFAFIGHDAGHGSISSKPRLNRLLGQLCMTVVTGLAFDEWIDRHRAHHRFCQIENQDPDMGVATVVSLTATAAQQKRGVGRFMLRYQHLFIWPLSFFFAHSQRHLSQLGVFLAVRRYALDAFVLILHFALWFGIPCGLLGVSFTTALWVYLIPMFILGPHLAAIFWVNHIGMPLIEDAEKFSFLEHQAVTSRSISNHAWLNWLFGGLNYQIEHHLFPQVPSSKLRTVQPIVRQHFATHQINYAEMTWWQSVQAVARHLHVVNRSASTQIQA